VPAESHESAIQAVPDTMLGRVKHFLSKDTTGGLLLVFAAVCALVIANSPARFWYQRLAATTLGPASLHLNLTVQEWTADALLAIFFLAIGLELKHELTVGSLRNPRQAGVPILAAVGGMALPAIIFSVIVALVGHGYGLGGWAIPTATDIAFALAVLGLFGARMPRGVRTFLLTLAVVDDLLAIIVIAAFYSHHLNWAYLAASLAVIALAARYTRTRHPKAWIAFPIGAVAWVLMHMSGVHATIAGVLLGLVVPARTMYGEHHARTHYWGTLVAPWSQGLALPLFAFFAAGVDLVDGGGFSDVVNQPVVLAIVAALILGKFLGVVGTAMFVTRRIGLHLAPGVRMRDLIPVGFLAGIGFTVALLVAELSYGTTGEMSDGARLAVLLGSLVSAVAGAFALQASMRRRAALAQASIAAQVTPGGIALGPVVRPISWLDVDEPEAGYQPNLTEDEDSGAFGEHPH